MPTISLESIEAAPSLVGGLILDKYMGIYVWM
jgi:hypothetical protein